MVESAIVANLIDKETAPDIERMHSLLRALSNLARRMYITDYRSRNLINRRILIPFVANLTGITVFK